MAKGPCQETDVKFCHHPPILAWLLNIDRTFSGTRIFTRDQFATMLSLSRQTPKRGTTCQRCLIIRYFVLVAFGIAIFTLIADSDRHYLGSATPMHAALAIMAVGVIGFVVKVAIWKLENRQGINSDPEQASPQEASRTGTGQTSTH